MEPEKLIDLKQILAIKKLPIRKISFLAEASSEDDPENYPQQAITNRNPQNSHSCKLRLTVDLKLGACCEHEV